jgi:peroxiredoxin
LGTLATEIRERGGEVVAVAVTPTFAQMKFADTLGVDFPLLSDWEGSTADAYGVRYNVWKGHRGLAKRSLFVIRPDRTITYRWVTEDALQLPDFDELMATVRSL